MTGALTPPTEESKALLIEKEQKNISHFQEILNHIPRPKADDNTVTDIEKLPDLSKRQSQCAHLLLQGKTAEETGQILKISKRTVEEHIRAMKQKLSCKFRSELIMKLASLSNQT